MREEAKELTRRLAAGDESAYGELYDRYGPGLFAAAARILGRRHDAEDAVQEVFAALARYRHRLAGVEDLAGYIYASLRRVAWRMARRARRDVGLETDPADRGAAPGGPAESGEAGERLRRATDRLPPRQREVIALKIDAQLTFEQIGRALGISPNTAASRYRYALARLRQALGEEP